MQHSHHAADRATARRAMEALPTIMRGVPEKLEAGLSLLTENNPVATMDGIRMLDRAAGIRACSHGFHGFTITSAIGAHCLPIYIVRRVEYERIARCTDMTEADISLLHSPFLEPWNVRQVQDVTLGYRYLETAMRSGVRFALVALTWLSPYARRARLDLTTSLRDDLLQAVLTQDTERALHAARLLATMEADADTTAREEEQKREEEQARGVTANALGFWLAHGHNGLPINAEEAVRYFRSGMRSGCAKAAVNLGLMYARGEGVSRDMTTAKQLYEKALYRGERNFAPAVLGMLLFDGADGVKRDVSAAARCLLLGITHGDLGGRKKCRAHLRIVMKSWRMRFAPHDLRRRCDAAIAQWEGEPGIGERDRESCDTRWRGRMAAHVSWT